MYRLRLLFNKFVACVTYNFLMFLSMFSVLFFVVFISNAVRVTYTCKSTWNVGEFYSEHCNRSIQAFIEYFASILFDYLFFVPLVYTNIGIAIAIHLNIVYFKLAFIIEFDIFGIKFLNFFNCSLHTSYKLND